jgi:hypothetical protein
VSWIFSFLLAGYLLVRIMLRARGQLRAFGLRDTLPVPPPLLDSAPGQLPPALAGLFLDARALRVAMTEARRTLMLVELTDPDAALGRVRDARYRRALMESWTKINRWLERVHQLDARASAMLADRHLGPEPIELLRESLRDKWRAVARSRALDLFELDDVHMVARAFEQIDLQLAALEQGLTQLGDDPYRDRHVQSATMQVM